MSSAAARAAKFYDEESGGPRTAGLGAAVVLLLAVSVAVTLVGGPADPLPDAALSSVVLFHAERSAALFLLMVGALALVRAAFAGQLPTELSPQGVKLAERGIEGMEARLRSLQRRVGEDEGQLDATEAVVRASESQIAAQRARIDALEGELLSGAGGGDGE